MATTQFNFDAFNKLTDDVAPGLKIALAQSLLRSAIWSMERYNNPLVDDLYGIGNELKEFRIKYKEAAAARQKKLENASERNADLDNHVALETPLTSAEGGKILENDTRLAA
jgi:hypothetical protein